MEEHWGVSIFLPDIRQPGTFPLNRAPTRLTPQLSPGYGQYYRARPDPDRNAYTGPDAPGQLLITRFDTVKNIVSGTFELTPRQDGGVETYAVTHGRFDLHFDR